MDNSNLIKNSYVQPPFYEITLSVPLILSFVVLCSWLLCIVARKYANDHYAYAVTSYKVNDHNDIDELPFAKSTIKKNHKYDMTGIYILPLFITLITFLMFLCFYSSLLPQFIIMNTWIDTIMTVTNKTYDAYECIDWPSAICYNINVNVLYSTTSHQIINSSKEYHMSSIHLYNYTEIMKLVDYPDIGKTFTGYYSPVDNTIWTDYINYDILTQLQLIILTIILSSLLIWQIICSIKIVYRKKNIKKVTLINYDSESQEV